MVKVIGKLILIVSVIALAGCQNLITNNPPSVPRIEISSQVVESEETIFLKASSTDPDGDSIVYTWSATEGHFSRNVGDSVDWMAPAVNDTDTVRITVRATDDKGAFSSNSINVLVIPSSTGGGIPGLIAHYPFNGNADDVSGNNFDGVTHNVTPTQDHLGNPMGALRFNGVNSYVEIPYEAINCLSQGSVAFWFKINTGNRQHSIIDKTETYVINDFQVIVHSNNRIRVNINVSYGQQKRLYSKTQIQPNRWYHSVITWDGNYWKIFIDGDLDTIAVRHDVVPCSQRRIYIGKVENNTSFMDGTIDDIRIYNRALTLDEVRELYNGTKNNIIRKHSRQKWR